MRLTNVGNGCQSGINMLLMSHRRGVLPCLVQASILGDKYLLLLEIYVEAKFLKRDIVAILEYHI